MFTRKYKWNLDKPLTLRGNTVHLIKEVKYLGITLDSKLQWKPHIESACNKAIRNLHHIRSSCNKTWGLKPAYTQWIYEQVVIPALSYGSIAWSHLIETKPWITDLLTHVQRSALLLITGAMLKTPTAHLEVITNLLPLDIRIRKAAIKTYLRLKITSNSANSKHGFRDGKLISHSQYLENQCKSLLPPQQLLDVAPATLNINLSYTICIKERTQALEYIPKLHETNDLIGYTDGSVKNNLAGTGVALYKNADIIMEKSQSLGNTTTIFQAEIMAILILCQYITTLDHQATALHICIDSKAAIQALNGTITRSHLVKDTADILNQLSQTLNITLHWVPAHSNIDGNEKADNLANIGSDNPPIGPHPFTPFTNTTLNNILDSHFRSMHRKRLINYKNKDLHLNLITSFFDKEHSIIKEMHRQDIRTITHLLTGCSFLGHYQKKIGNEHSSICNKCQEEDETTAHYLARCPAFILYRKHYFGNFIILQEGSLTLRITPTNLLAYAKATKYLNFYEPP